MFHCNGWCFPWAVTAAGATHVCLRKVEPGASGGCSAEGRHALCGAPTVLVMLGLRRRRRTALDAAGHRHDRGRAAPARR